MLPGSKWTILSSYNCDMFKRLLRLTLPMQGSLILAITFLWIGGLGAVLQAWFLAAVELRAPGAGLRPREAADADGTASSRDREVPADEGGI